MTRKTTKVATLKRKTAVKKDEAEVQTQESASTPEANTQDSEGVVKRKEFIQRVADRLSLRPNQVRLICDAVLEEIGDALVNGEKLKTPPLGQLRVTKHQELPNAVVVTCKLRRPNFVNESSEDASDNEE